MKRPLFLTLILAFLLVACQGATPLPAPTEAAPQTAIVPPTASATSTTIPEETALASGNTPGCVVQSPFPTPGPTEQSLFPPVSDRDWTQGLESATVTFTEYSDFQ
jgi:hypothetical protein